MSLCPLPQLVLSWTSTATLVVSFSPHLSPLPFLPWMLVTTTLVVGELEKVLLPLHWDIPSTHTLHCKCQHSKLTIFLISSELLPVSSDFYLLCWVPVPHFQPRSHHISLQPFTTGPISTFRPNAQCVLCKVRWHCIFYDAVSDTIRRRGGYRGIITEEGVDTVTYFGGNHGSRVWKSLKLKKVYFPRTRTSWDKYMFNRIVFFKF